MPANNVVEIAPGARQHGAVATPDGGETSPIDEISLTELAARLNDRAMTIVDVLPATAYQQEHIPGAVNLPLAEVVERAPAVLPDRHAEIVVYCGGFT
jgi:rhodanese-related sulfurtransferase